MNYPLVRIVVAIAFIAVPFAMVSTPLNLFVTDKLLRRMGALLLAAVVLAAYSTYVRVIEKRAVTELSTSRAALELCSGWVLGALLLSATVGILAALGVYQVTGQNDWRTMLAFLPACILAGIFEEVLIRGILFRILEQWLGSWTALGISAVIFGALHLFNPGATLLNGAAIALEAGILLGAAFMLTRRLWLCMGMHMAWNFTEGGIFSAAVSGGAGKGLLQAKLVGPDWLTGGKFGVEASVVALAICLSAAIVALILAVKRGHIIPSSWNKRIAGSIP